MEVYITTSCARPEFQCSRCKKNVKDHCWTWAGPGVRVGRKYCTACGEEIETRIAKRTGENICIEDFAGNNRQPGFWADWWPARSVVTFGGAWFDVPDMPSATRPTDSDCMAWANLHCPDWN